MVRRQFERIRKLAFQPIGWVKTIPWRGVLTVGVPIVIGLGLAVWIAAKYVTPTPPSKIVMATGPAATTYAGFGDEYRKVLARSGIRLETRETAGARENYRLLKDPAGGVDIGFVRGGIGAVEEAPHLVSLGVVGYEALWVFCKGKNTLDDLPGLKGKTVAIGAKGAGMRRMVRELLAANGIGDDDFTPLEVGGVEAAEALLGGTADCAFLLEAPEAGILKALIYADGAQLVDFSRRADAYTKHLPFLGKVVLPEGGNDLAGNRPPHPVTLLTAQTQLLVRDDLHPAIQMLLINAARDVHRDSGLFNGDGEFPTLHRLDFPIAADAPRLYASGRPFLHRYLPFWVANLIDRALVFLIPAVAILFPLVRLLPPLYAWRMRRRIYRWYGELMFIENEMRRTLTSGETRDFRERLDWIETEVNEITTPLSYANQLYSLRQHIDFVQHQLEYGDTPPTGTPAAASGPPAFLQETSLAPPL